MANAHPTRCDQQGRILIPEEHLHYASIKKEVLIIGVVNKLEFWNPRHYSTFMTEGNLNTQDRVRQFGGVDREWPWDA
jgi:MraZ protein